MKKSLGVFFVGLAAAFYSNAASYYIDYDGGNDSNTGLTQTQPWKLAPGMAGFAGQYTHAPGDHFYFKGGVTWPRSCFQWKISGRDGTPDNWDYYGADPQWFFGDSFKRPLFDFNSDPIGLGTAGAGILFYGCDYVVLDNLELANHAAPIPDTGQSIWGSFTVCFDGGSNVTVSNCLIRDWCQPNSKGVIASGKSGGGGVICVNGTRNARVTGCTFTQAGSATKNGSCVWNVYWVDGCEMSHCASAIMTAGLVEDNDIHDLMDPSDPAAHSNAMLNYGPFTIRRNAIHDILTGTAQVLLLVVCPDWVTTAPVNYVYDNVIYNVAQTPIVFDTRYQNLPATLNYCWNNTTYAPGGTSACIRVGVGNGNLGHLEVKNNHYITSGNPYLMNNPVAGGGYVNKFIESNNLTQTPAQAASYGYTSANGFAPTDSGDPTVGTGADLSARFTEDISGVQRTAPWDIGAYEWMEISTVLPTPPTELAATTESSSSIALTWVDANDETGYLIYRSSATEGETVIGSAPGNATSYVDTGLMPSTTYVYKVEAVNSIGRAESGSVSATTDAVTLVMPGNLIAKSSKKGISLTWTDTNAGEMGYEILRTGDGFDVLTLLPPNSIKFTDTAVKTRTTYTYSVYPVSGETDGPASQVTITVR